MLVIGHDVLQSEVELFAESVTLSGSCSLLLFFGFLIFAHFFFGAVVHFLFAAVTLCSFLGQLGLPFAFVHFAVIFCPPWFTGWL